MDKSTELPRPENPDFLYRIHIGQMIGKAEEVEGINTDPEPKRVPTDENVSEMPQWPETNRVGSVIIRGLEFDDPQAFANWRAAVQGTDTQPEDVSIILLGTGQHPQMEWKLQETYPTQMDTVTNGESEAPVKLDALELKYNRIRKADLTTA